jgi:hypothetical protein
MAKSYTKPVLRINPLKHMFSRKSLIFFDGDDVKQLNWALEEYKKKMNC